MTIIEKETKALRDLAQAHKDYLDAKKEYEDLRKVVDFFSDKQTTRRGCWIVDYIKKSIPSIDWEAIQKDYPDFDKSKYEVIKVSMTFKGVHKEA